MSYALIGMGLLSSMRALLTDEPPVAAPTAIDTVQQYATALTARVGAATAPTFSSSQFPPVTVVSSPPAPAPPPSMPLLMPGVLTGPSPADQIKAAAAPPPTSGVRPPLKRLPPPQPQPDVTGGDAIPCPTGQLWNGSACVDTNFADRGHLDVGPRPSVIPQPGWWSNQPPTTQLAIIGGGTVLLLGAVVLLSR